MNRIDSDLEEGEILDDDDSPSSPIVCDKKYKELPRRYVVNDKSNNYKHKKKDCKHAIRHQAKKLSKLKSPVKMKHVHKSHKSPCYEKSSKYSDRNSSSSISKNHNSLSRSLISEIKSSCKVTFHKRSTKSSNFDLQNADNLTKDFSASKILCFEDLKSSEVDKKNNEFLETSVSGSAHHNPVSIKNIDHSLIIPDSKTDCPVKSDLTPCNLSEAESEDEQILRKIALESFGKRKDVVDSSERVIQGIEISNTSVPDPANINDIPCQEASNPVSDNYEVVDMDVDDDDYIEVIDSPVTSQECERPANLFVIDTNPSSDFLGNKENAPSELQSENNNSDDDFEADILRAELIEKLTRKQYSENKQVQKSDVSVFPNTKPDQKPVPTIPERKFVKYQKLAKIAAVNYLRKPLRSHIQRKNTINKSIALLKKSNNNKKSDVPLPTNKPSERLIISLNEESSSSEDSDNDDESSSVAENPVDSIVALISDCRQKSDDSTEKTKETAVNVPKAVSCLSKSQQAKYNLYMKILAQKEKLPAGSNKFSQKNDSVPSPFLDKLKQLEKELAKLKDTLKHKKESVTSLSKEINTKKSTYLKAKLSAQHLREQFIAAEKVRKTKLMEWSKAVDRLKFMRQAVSDLEKQINKVETLCSKIGPSKQGQSCNLPLLPQNNKQS